MRTWTTDCAICAFAATQPARVSFAPSEDALSPADCGPRRGLSAGHSSGRLAASSVARSLPALPRRAGGQLTHRLRVRSGWHVPTVRRGREPLTVRARRSWAGRWAASRSRDSPYLTPPRSRARTASHEHTPRSRIHRGASNVDVHGNHRRPPSRRLPSSAMAMVAAAPMASDISRRRRSVRSVSGTTASAARSRPGRANSS